MVRRLIWMSNKIFYLFIINFNYTLSKLQSILFNAPQIFDKSNANLLHLHQPRFKRGFSGHVAIKLGVELLTSRPQARWMEFLPLIKNHIFHQQICLQKYFAKYQLFCHFMLHDLIMSVFFLWKYVIIGIVIEFKSRLYNILHVLESKNWAQLVPAAHLKVIFTI